MSDSTEQPPTASKPDQGPTGFRLFLEKFGIALAPALAYYLVFTYERSYCGKFGVPASFIRPDLTTVLIYASAVLGVGFFLVWLVDAWLDALRDTTAIQPLQRAATIYGPFVTLTMFAVYLYMGHWKRWIWIVFPILMGTVADFIAALRGPNAKPFLARLEGPTFALVYPGSVFDVARKRLSTEVFMAFIAVYIAIAISRALGESEALNQRTYYVPSTLPESAVIRVYGDKMVCVAFDLKTKKPVKRFQILPVSGDGKMVLEAKQIGPMDFD